jgi:hypothetical protein
MEKERLAALAVEFDYANGNVLSVEKGFLQSKAKKKKKKESFSAVIFLDGLPSVEHVPHTLFPSPVNIFLCLFDWR